MRKYAIYVSPDCLKIEGQHKLITLSSGEKSIRFIRGRDNLVKKGDKLVVLFSDLKKPVKLLKNNEFEVGATPAQIIKDFGLEVFEVEVEDREGQDKPQGKFTIEQRINYCKNALQTLIESLPREVNVTALRNMIEDLNLLKTQLGMRGNNPRPQDRTF